MFFKVNKHSIGIEADKNEIFKEIVLWGESAWWPKDSNMKFVNESGQAVSEGTDYSMKIIPFGPSWRARVTKLEKDYSIRRDFLDGMFTGFETVSILEKGKGSEVVYEMFYRVNNIVNKILWPLALERIHNSNINKILVNLKNHLEAK